MKIMSAVAAASFFALQSISAQENPPREKLDLIPSSPGPAPSAVTPNPLPLIPESPESEKKKGKGTPGGTAKKEKKTSTEAAIDDLQGRIRFRQVKTRVLNDPAVQDSWARAHAMRTDSEKREALKAYYKLFYDRMLRIDGTLKQRIVLSQQRAMRRLAQTRIDPSEPIDPEEREERFRE